MGYKPDWDSKNSAGGLYLTPSPADQTCGFSKPWRTSGIAAWPRSRKFLYKARMPSPHRRPHTEAVQVGRVVGNRQLCREHYRLTIRLPSFPVSYPGQFVHLAPTETNGDPADEESASGGHSTWAAALVAPFLRRAFSIAGLRRAAGGADVDVIHRVVGAATRWMASLRVGDEISVLGPLGNRFPISSAKSHAWMVAGGVGLPPMLWLAEALHDAGRETIAFCGAQTADLVALTLDATLVADAYARTARPVCHEFAEAGTPAIISTDDGSLGFHGYVGSALAAHYEANPASADDLIVYTCGPEPMMRFVAEFCVSRGIECHVCMERAMACGTGLCQSCVVPVRDALDSEGWLYRLCCTDGPVFPAESIVWEPRPQAGKPVEPQPKSQ